MTAVREKESNGRVYRAGLRGKMVLELLNVGDLIFPKLRRICGGPCTVECPANRLAVDKLSYPVDWIIILSEDSPIIG
jgi:hypothetical protein